MQSNVKALKFAVTSILLVVLLYCLPPVDYCLNLFSFVYSVFDSYLTGVTLWRSYSSCSQLCTLGYSTHPAYQVWQWQIGAIAVFLAWIDLILFFAKFPRIGIYSLIFVKIISTFVKAVFVSALLSHLLLPYTCPSMNHP